MDNQKSLKKNAFFSFLNSFTSLVFPLITFPYASRILNPDGIGQVNFAVQTESFFALIAGLGIASYATREAARLRDNRLELSKFCREIISINFISMLISYSLLGLALLFIPKFEQYRILILVRSTNIFFTTIGLEWLYRAEEDFKYITIRSLIFKFTGLAFLFIFVKTKDDKVEYIIFGILTSVASNICNFIHSRKYIDYKQKFNLELSKHLKYIFLFFGMSFVSSIYTILDTEMLGFLSNDTQVGYYTAATKLNKLSLGLLNSLIAVLLPRLSYYKQNNEDKKFIELSEKAASVVILLSIPMVVGLITLAKPLVLVFSGEKYIEAIPAMNIISPIVFAISISTLIGTQIFPAIKKEKITLISIICGAITNVVINTIFIPKYGAIGAALGTLIAEFAVTTVQIIYLSKYISKNILISLFHSIISCIPLSLIIIGLTKLIKNNLILIIICIIISVIIYFLMLILLKNRYFNELILQKIKEKLLRFKENKIESGESNENI